MYMKSQGNESTFIILTCDIKIEKLFYTDLHSFAMLRKITA